MKTKKRMRYLALFIASVVAFTMLPTSLMESYAAPLTYPGYVAPSACGSFVPASSPFEDYCCTCGHTSSEHSSSSSSSSSTSTVTTTVTTEESSEPGISPEEQKRLDDEALQQKLQEMYKKNSRVAVGGRYVTSTLPGAYEATGVKGIAVTTPKEEIVKRFKYPYKVYYKLDGKDYCTTSYRVLPKGTDDKTKEKYEDIMQGSDGNVTVETWDVNEKKSPEAYKCLQNAAAQTGGNLGSAFEIKFEMQHTFDTAESKATSKHVIELKDAIEVKAGLPDDMVGKEVAIAQVVEGGETQILKDQDNDPNTVTFNVTYSEGAYGLVKTTPQASGALKALVKALLNDEEGIGHVWSDNLAVDPDALAAYLQDKPEEQEFLAKYNNVLKEAYADPNWDNASPDERLGIQDQYFVNNGLGHAAYASHHLYEINVAARALAQ